MIIFGIKTVYGVKKFSHILKEDTFFFADSNLILMNRFYVKYYSSIKIGCSMHNGINTNYYLAIGAEKHLGSNCSSSRVRDRSIICSCPLFVTAKVILFSE